MSTATATQETPESPSLEELASRKEEGYTKLFAASNALKNAWREIAHQESLCAAYLIGLGRNDEAALNLNAEANALMQAGEYVEASGILGRIVEVTHNPRLKTAALEAKTKISGFVDALKNEKRLDEVLQLVESIGGDLTASADGAKGATRFCEFTYKGLNFHVDISTIYHVTHDNDTEGYEVQALERLEARLNEAVDKAGIATRVEAELAEADYEEDDDFDDNEFPN